MATRNLFEIMHANAWVLVVHEIERMLPKAAATGTIDAELRKLTLAQQYRDEAQQVLARRGTRIDGDVSDLVYKLGIGQISGDASDGDERAMERALDKRALSQYEDGQRSEGGTWQNRQDVLRFLEHHIVGFTDPSLLRESVEISDLHFGMASFAMDPEGLGYPDGFRSEIFLRILHELYGHDYFFGASGQISRTSIVPLDLFLLFMRGYIAEYVVEDTLSQLKNPIPIAVLHREFNRLYRYSFSRRTFLNLLIAAFGAEYFSGENEGRDEVRISELLDYKEVVKEARASVKGSKAGEYTREHEIAVHIVAKHSIGKSVSKKEAQDILSEAIRDVRGRRDKRVVRELSAAMRTDPQTAEKMIWEARAAFQGGGAAALQEPVLPPSTARGPPRLSIPGIIRVETGITSEPVRVVDLEAGRGDFMEAFGENLGQAGLATDMCGLSRSSEQAQDGRYRGRNIYPTRESGDLLRDMRGELHVVIAREISLNRYRAYIEYGVELMSEDGLFIVQPAELDRPSAESEIRYRLSDIPSEHGFRVLRINAERCVGLYQGGRPLRGELYIIKHGNSPFRIASTMDPSDFGEMFEVGVSEGIITRDVTEAGDVVEAITVPSEAPGEAMERIAEAGSTQLDTGTVPEIDQTLELARQNYFCNQLGPRELAAIPSYIEDHVIRNLLAAAFLGVDRGGISPDRAVTEITRRLFDTGQVSSYPDAAYLADSYMRALQSNVSPYMMAEDTSQDDASQTAKRKIPEQRMVYLMQFIRRHVDLGQRGFTINGLIDEIGRETLISSGLFRDIPRYPLYLCVNRALMLAFRRGLLIRRAVLEEESAFTYYLPSSGERMRLSDVIRPDEIRARLRDASRLMESENPHDASGILRTVRRELTEARNRYHEDNLDAGYIDELDELFQELGQREEVLAKLPRTSKEKGKRDKQLSLAVSKKLKELKKKKGEKGSSPGAGMTDSPVGILPHWGEGYANECIVKTLREVMMGQHKRVPEGPRRRFLDWCSRMEAEEKPLDRVPPEVRIPIEHLVDEEREVYDIVETPGGRPKIIKTDKTLNVVILPKDELGRISLFEGPGIVKEVPFYGHVGLEEGTMWVAAGGKGEFTIMHEAQEYGIVSKEARKRGWTMEEMRLWRDGQLTGPKYAQRKYTKHGGFDKALEFFRQAHVTAWRHVAILCEEEYLEELHSATVSFDTAARDRTLKRLKERSDRANAYYDEAKKLKPIAIPQEAGIAVASSGEPVGPEGAKLEAAVKKMLDPEGPQVVRVKDIRTWKALQKAIGLKDSYAVGYVWDIAVAQAKETGITLIESVQKLKREDRFKVFIYDPLDNGCATHHELMMHHAMRMRSHLVARKTGVDTLITAGAASEYQYVTHLMTLLRDHGNQETYDTFQQMVKVLREQYRLVATDLSQELFAWIGTLREYPNYMSGLQVQPGTENAEYLKEHMARTSRLVSAVSEFNKAAEGCPMVKQFLDGYYEALAKSTPPSSREAWLASVKTAPDTPRPAGPEGTGGAIVKGTESFERFKQILAEQAEGGRQHFEDLSVEELEILQDDLTEVSSRTHRALIDLYEAIEKKKEEGYLVVKMPFLFAEDRPNDYIVDIDSAHERVTDEMRAQMRTAFGTDKVLFISDVILGIEDDSMREEAVAHAFACVGMGHQEAIDEQAKVWTENRTGPDDRKGDLGRYLRAKIRIAETCQKLLADMDKIRALDHFSEAEIAELITIFRAMPNLPINTKPIFKAAFGVGPLREEDEYTLDNAHFTITPDRIADYTELEFESTMLHEATHLLRRQRRWMDEVRRLKRLRPRYDVDILTEDAPEVLREQYLKETLLDVECEREAFLVTIKYFKASVPDNDAVAYFEKLKREAETDTVRKRAEDTATVISALESGGEEAFMKSLRETMSLLETNYSLLQLYAFWYKGVRSFPIFRTGPGWTFEEWASSTIQRHHWTMGCVDAVRGEVADLKKEKKLAIIVDTSIGNMERYGRRLARTIEGMVEEMGLSPDQIEIIVGEGSALVSRVSTFLHDNENAMVRGVVSTRNQRHYAVRFDKDEGIKQRMRLVAVNDEEVSNTDEHHLHYNPIMPAIRYSLTGEIEPSPYTEEPETVENSVIGAILKFRPAEPVNKDDLFQRLREDAIFLENA